MSPAVSAIGSDQPPFALQVTDAAVAAPFASSSGSGVERTAPAAAFQFVCGITPAHSDGVIAVGLLPAKSMPIEAGATDVGTICSPFTGARRVPPSGVVG